MSFVFTEISDRYKQETGIGPKLSFGSSGNFAQQILHGAPYRLFLSAGKKYIDFLIHNGVEIDARIDYARGRIGFFVPNGSSLYAQTGLDRIIKSLIYDQFHHLVIANPEHAPYGMAAKQSLQRAGLWAIERDKLLVGESAAQAMQFTLSGGVDLGIIPASFARLPEIKNRGKFYLIPEAWHQPIQQYLILLKGADKSTRAFYRYLLSDKAKNIIRRYGYKIRAGDSE